MSEQNTVTTQAQATEDTKTFTQDEVNGIVADRLARERSKYTDYEALKEKAKQFDAMEEANKSELDKAKDRASELQKELDNLKKADSIRTIRDTVASETGVPASLLTADTEDECKAQASQILEFAKPKDYPAVPDGGETHYTGKKDAREQFAQWFNNLDK